eukprot:jgi/Orpsp1_1/1175237/evm.model.c7180000053122.1
MAYWTLGWHQCRYGYKNIDQVEYVLDQMEKKKIPFDTMWIDIDFMDHYKDLLMILLTSQKIVLIQNYDRGIADDVLLRMPMEKIC